MKTLRIAFVVPVVALMFASLAAFANDEHKKSDKTAVTSGQLIPAEKADAAWLEKARADYPLTSCVVSGDEFDGGDMGKPKDFIYRVDGKPDRLVRFCCRDCVKDFNEDPDKYLDEIAAASHGEHH